MSGLPWPLDAPVEFKWAPVENRYAPAARGAVSVVPVVLGDAEVGSLWWSDGESAAGWIANRHLVGGQSEAASQAGGAWSRHLQRSAEKGLAPSVAAQGESLASSAGAVDPSRVHVVDGLKAVWSLMGRTLSPLRSVIDDAVEASMGRSVGSQTLDAGLQGRVPMSQAMVEQAADMDGILRRRPTPQPLVVTRSTILGHLALEPESLLNECFVESGYFATRLGEFQTAPGKDAVIALSVPEGTPALFIAGETPEQSMLLLARGLTYRVTHMQRDGMLWRISAAVIGNGAPPSVT